MVTVTVRSGAVISTLKVKRPAWAYVYAGYPKTSGGIEVEDDIPAPTIFAEIFGPEYNRKTYSNACGTRVSLALLAGGMNRVGSRQIKITAKSHIYYGKSIEPGADKLKEFLESTWGKPENKITAPVTIEKTYTTLKNKKGIYIMIPKRPDDFGATGHATLWTGNRVIGNHHYISDNTHAVYFWELK